MGVKLKFNNELAKYDFNNSTNLYYRPNVYPNDQYVTYGIINSIPKIKFYKSSYGQNNNYKITSRTELDLLNTTSPYVSSDNGYLKVYNNKNATYIGELIVDNISIPSSFNNFYFEWSLIPYLQDIKKTTRTTCFIMKFYIDDSKLLTIRIYSPKTTTILAAGIYYDNDETKSNKTTFTITNNQECKFKFNIFKDSGKTYYNCYIEKSVFIADTEMTWSNTKSYKTFKWDAYTAEGNGSIKQFKLNYVYFYIFDPLTVSTFLYPEWNVSNSKTNLQISDNTTYFKAFEFN